MAANSPCGSLGLGQPGCLIRADFTVKQLADNVHACASSRSSLQSGDMYPVMTAYLLESCGLAQSNRVDTDVGVEETESIAN